MSTQSQEEQAERIETLRNDQSVRQQQGSTYLDHTHSDLGGRFAQLGGPQTITGKSPEPPPLPKSSPWSGPDPCGDEPALGYSIDKVGRD
jgi:hypothetical protein